jgi:hypothetical protein
MTKLGSSGCISIARLESLKPNVVVAVKEGISSQVNE